MKPISPNEARTEKIKGIPPEVIDAFNELITENLSQGHAVVKQDEVVKRICAKLNVERDEVFKKNWLDVETIFRKQGWKVEYDKPAYNESYEAYFEFSSKKARTTT